MKKFIAILLTALLATSVFAQKKVDCVNVSDTDCQMYAKNYAKIFKEIPIYKENYKPSKNGAKEDVVLEKYGITGPNRVGKVTVINQVLGTIAAAEEMEKSPDAKMMKAMGIDPLAQMKQMLNEKDFEVVQRNYKILKPVVNYLMGLDIQEDERDIGQDFLDEYEANMKAAEEEEKKSKAEKEAALKAAKAKYKEDLAYAKALKKTMASSKADQGMLCAEYDAKKAGKYKLVKVLSEDNYTNFSDGHYFTIEYDNEYYKGYIELFAEYDCNVSYAFTDFNSYNNEYKVSDDFTLTATKVELYSASKNSDAEGEVVIYTKEAGVIHLWFKGDKAILRCGGLGTLEGTHRVSMP